ncbi:copper resistance protein CopC [Plantactinospora mayteni]|uniref:Transport integral membrane protein n=1 Tax=Plantactinospora mayteni TaxID=566021 RepID=A0ABQ4F3M4_9ACTN|nr:copper resistance protein CopC [Plantactinospora mayteni]GIH01514.1 transport integral membrane protein [Plantactinospora mayteni]
MGSSRLRPVPLGRAALAVLLFVGLAVLFGPARPAAAHAAVLGTVPQQQAVLGFSPTEVTITFSEPVALVAGRVQVLAPDGKRINDGDATVRDATLRIPIRVADRPLGTYLVSYRVISADSHPVAGSYTFSVGAASATPPEPAEETVRPDVRVAVPVTRYLGYAGLVLLVGPTLLLGLLWPRRLPRRGAVRLVRAGLLLVALGTLAGFWAQAPYTSGAGLLDVSGAELRQVLDSDFGLALAARLGILLLVAALLPPVLAGRAGRVRVGLLVALGLAGLATWPLAGHAAASPTPLASGIASVVHLAAMSVWLGGLVAMVGFPLRAAHPRVLAVILPVWSRWATIAVLWLVAGGVVQAMIEIGAPGALFGTGYGRLVLAKVALLALLLGAAGYARRLVRRRTTATPAKPADSGQTADGGQTADNGQPADSGEPANSGQTADNGELADSGQPADSTEPAVAGRRRLRRTVGLEVLVGLVVLGVSSVLVQTTPGRNAGIEAEIAASDTFAQTLSSPLYTLQFDIYPVQLGPNNTVHAYVYTPDGRPLPAVEWTLTAALPAQGVEPTDTPMLGVEPHHGAGAVNFPIPGDWELRFTVRLSEIDQATVRTVVRVR